MKNQRIIVILFIVGATLALTSLLITYFATGRIEWLRLLTFMFSIGLAYVIYNKKR